MEPGFPRSQGILRAVLATASLPPPPPHPRQPPETLRTLTRGKGFLEASAASILYSLRTGSTPAGRGERRKETHSGHCLLSPLLPLPGAPTAQKQALGEY